MAATPSTDATREETDNTGSSVGGIVAGCVVAFIVFAGIVVCLIIFLLWYRAKKKRTYTTKSSTVVRSCRYQCMQQLMVILIILNIHDQVLTNDVIT